MEKLRNNQTDALIQAILSLKNGEECYLFLEDLCTIKELQAMNQRFQVACLLDEGKNYMEVCDATGASSATISRVNKCLTYGAGGYRQVLDRLREGEESQ